MKRIFTITLLLSIFLFLGNKQSKATHFAGADLTYTCLGGNTYLITLYFYRDCSGINAPNNTSISFKCSSNPSLNFTSVVTKKPNTGMEIPLTCSQIPTSCTNGATSQYGIREYVYQSIITLQACSNWTMSWHSGNRNTTSTITNGNYNEWNVEAMLNNAAAPYNSSPTFTNKPIIQVNNNQSFNYSQGAYDINGDSLSYSFFNPKTNTTSHISYIPPYSYTNFLSSSTPITIDPISGNMSFTPNLVLSTICGIKVEEWRTINDTAVLIGIIYRDVQLIVTNNSNTIPTLSGIDTSLSNTYNANDTNFRISQCINDGPINFTIKGFDADTFNAANTGSPEKFHISWNHGIPGASFYIANNGTDSAYAEFLWFPDYYSVNKTRNFTVKIHDYACPYKAIQSFTYSVTPIGLPIKIDQSYFPICSGDSITLKAFADINTVNYIWSVNGVYSGVPYNQDSIILSSTNVGLGTHNISIKTNNGSATTCPGKDSTTLIIDYQPHIHNSMPDTTICDNASIVLDAGPGTIHKWTKHPYWVTIGNSQTLTISEPGFYRVFVDGGYYNHCIDADSFEIKVKASPPIVDFGNDTTINNYYSLYLALPSGYSNYLWSTGDTSQSIIIDNSYNWVNSIIGKVTANNQCFSSDTILVYIGNVGFNNNINSSINIFPNPVINTLNIELENNNGETNIKIYDIKGQLYRNETFHVKNHKVKSLDNLQVGVYILYLSNSDNNIIMKFIKE